MKTVLTAVFCVAVALFLLLGLPSAGEEAVYDSVLRLHVLANSDSTEDQSTKLAVRDALLNFTEEEMLCFASLEEAETWVEDSRDDILAAVMEVLTAHGCPYSACISLEKKYFDTRVYEGFTLPAGYYSSLTVTLGEGRGQNFFCMLYPALCVTPALGGETDKAEKQEGKSLFTDSGYALKLRSLEVLAALFGKE